MTERSEGPLHTQGRANKDHRRTGLFLTTKLFRHTEDRLPVAIVIALTTLDFAAYFWLKNVWLLVAYWLFMAIPKGTISAWNHHHQHAFTFRSVVLNRALELCYALHTGMTTNVWVLHHVLGHHQNYLDQSKDESAWRGRDGKAMGTLAYTFNVALTAYPRAYAVGRKHPRHQRTFLSFAVLTALLVGGLIYAKPLQGLFLFALPMVTSLLFTAWVTYDHHVKEDTEDHFQASYNIMNRWFNRLTGNLGYHTAHHYRQGVHWSRLPELHETIAHRIPPELYIKTTFDLFLPDTLSASQTSAEPAE